MTGKKILVVDDNPMNMELVSDLLEVNGYQVLQAGDASAAIDLAGNEIPDLILMDIQLPGMDGIQATRILKDDPATRKIPVVALTAHAMKGDEKNILEAGCVGYITKPIDTRKFQEAVAEFFNTQARD